MKTDNFDAVLAGIRAEAVDPATVDRAANRVRTRLFATDTGAAQPADRLRDCSGFRALIPAYLNRSLAPAKSLLLADHTHSCVSCRQAVETARSGNLRILERPKAVSSRVSPVTRWAIAAMATIGVGLGTWAAVSSMRVSPGARATVQNVTGILYQVADSSSTPVFAGRELGERQIVRTAKDSNAMLQLADGSMVEMNQRSELSIAHAVRGTTIHLDRGNIIVHAAKQLNGALYVKTADCEVMVKGTIFAVTSGIKGARVSVVEGSVKVDNAGQSQMLKPGDQVNTSASEAKVPIQDEISWSRDSAKYLAVLGELSNIQKQLEQMPPNGLRTSSSLIELAPANTVLYAAIPNIGATVGEANRLFQERIQASPVLKQWWDEQGNHGTQLQEMVRKFQTMSGYLGNEIVLAFSADGKGKTSSPIILANAQRPGLKEFLQAEIATANARSAKPVFALQEGAGASTDQAAATHVYLANGIVAFSPDASLVHDLSGHFQQNAGPRFADTSFYERIQQSYQSGADWLFCADLGRMNRHFGNSEERRGALKDSGLNGVQYLILERKDMHGQTSNQATLAFNGARQGLASWLAAPGPMSTLDFVSPTASLAGSFVIKNPGALLSEFISRAEASNPDFAQKLNEFQNRSGVNVVNDLAAPLGGELTFAIDGPLLPIPSWKVAVEVYSPDRLQWAIEHLITAFNQEPGAPAQLQLTKSPEGARTFYTIKATGSNADKIPAEIDYVFVDSYLLAAANRSLLNAAIQNRSTGYTLARSEKFRSQLPHDANSNFSGIVYHDVSGLIGPLVDNLKSVNAISPDQKQAIDSLQANSAPGLIYAYGEPDRITIATNGRLFDLNLLGNLMRLHKTQ